MYSKQTLDNKSFLPKQLLDYYNCGSKKMFLEKYFKIGTKPSNEDFFLIKKLEELLCSPLCKTEEERKGIENKLNKILIKNT